MLRRHQFLLIGTHSVDGGIGNISDQDAGFSQLARKPIGKRRVVRTIIKCNQIKSHFGHT